MVKGWTVCVGTAGGALTDYTSGIPEFFIERLNGMGFFSALLLQLDGNAVPTREQIVRFVWNKGESDERDHFHGYITDVRRIGNGKSYRLRGLSLEGLLWQSTVGAVRNWTTQTPHTIIQAAGSPNGLLYNSQGNLRPIAATSLQYGSSASVPNKVDGSNPGTALSFRADSSRNLVNIQRLCLQSRYDGSSYGLEFFAQLEGANTSDPRFYLVKRRNRASMVAETFTIPTNFFMTHRGTEGLTAAQAMRVVGTGDGANRIESSLVGSGGLEGIVADKTVLEATNATNMANRLQELLNPSTELVTGWHFGHTHATQVGDDVTVAQSGEANVTLRVFERGYSLQQKGFFFTLGRPRPLQEDPFYKLDQLAGGQAHGPQKTNETRIGSSSVNLAQPATSGTVTVVDSTSEDLTLTFSDRTYDADEDEGIAFLAQISVAGGGSYFMEITDSAGGTAIMRQYVGGVPDASTLNFPVYLPSQALIEFWGNGTIGSANLRVTNKSGVDKDFVIQLSGWVVPKHEHA